MKMISNNRVNSTINFFRSDLKKDKKIYEEEIHIRNYRNLISFTFGGTVITGLIVISGLLTKNYTGFVLEYMIFFLYFLVWSFISQFCLKKTKRITLIFYIELIPIYIGAIMMGTFLDPKLPAITIMLFLATLTLFIIDKPERIICFLLCISILFCICSYFSKTVSLFVTDIVDLIIYLCISIGANILVLSDRVEGIKNYVIVKKQAEIDNLTTIYNRLAGQNKVERLLENSQKGSFFMIDIDHFKMINDTFGHQIDDEIIKMVSHYIVTCSRNEDVVWRLGGDEFAVYALDLMDEEKCIDFMNDIRTELKNIKISNGDTLSINISMGCVICDLPGIGFDQLYKLSDSALYEAKNNGRDGYKVYFV